MDTLFLIGLMFLAYLATGLRVVRQQTLAIVELLGKFNSVLEPGLRWIIPPPFGKVVFVANLRIVEVKAPVEVKTSDNVFVTMPVSLMLKVVSDKAADSYYQLENPEEQLKTWTLNAFRSVVNKMTLNDLFSDRAHIEAEVTQTLRNMLMDYGFELTGLLVEQPSVSAEVQHAFNRVVASEREKEAAHREGEAQKIKIVAAAQAEAEGQIARAKGVAESRRIIADSYAQGIQDISAKTSGVDVEKIMNLMLEINRLDALRDAGRNGNLILMDTQSPNTGLQSALLSSLLAKKTGSKE